MIEEQLVIERVAPPQPDALATIVSLGKKMIELDALVTTQTQVLESTVATRKDIAERLLPDLLTSVGLTNFTLSSGEKIRIKTEYYANISNERSKAAFEWLRANNMGGIIKEAVTVSPSAKDKLVENSIPFVSKEAVHPATLKAVAKEQIEAGKVFPTDLFGVHIANKAVME